MRHRLLDLDFNNCFTVLLNLSMTLKMSIPQEYQMTCQDSKVTNKAVLFQDLRNLSTFPENKEVHHRRIVVT